VGEGKDDWPKVAFINRKCWGTNIGGLERETYDSRFGEQGRERLKTHGHQRRCEFEIKISQAGKKSTTV